MDPEVLESTLAAVTKQIETMKLDRVAPPAPGQPAGAWADDALNKSLVQEIAQLKARGAVPYEMGAKGSLDGARAFDCSGFVSAMMHRANENIEASAGRPVMKPLSGTAADMVVAARAGGGAISPSQLLAHPEPGTIIGLATHNPNEKWAQGRPLGIDHVAVVIRDTDGVCKVAEYCPNPNGGPGLRITPLEPWIRHYAAKGADIYPATPAGMHDPAALASLHAHAEAGQGQYVAQAETPQGPVTAS
jgi:hypothetical protein